MTIVNPPRPSVPPPYVGGTVILPTNLVVNLIDLIHLQINKDAPGTSTEFMISADANNQAPVYVGSAAGNAYNPAGGSNFTPLSIVSFSYMLTPTACPRVYRSSYPGGSTPIGILQVLSQAPGAILHIEAME